MNKQDAIFSVRYAVIVLERYSALWKCVSNVCRVGSLLAGSGAIAGLSNGSPSIALMFGIVFALLQAFDFGMSSEDKAARALAQRRPYADLWSRAEALDDLALETAYKAIVAADEIKVGDRLKEIAYNDVLLELGRDQSYLYSTSLMKRILSALA